MIVRVDQHLENELGPIERGWQPAGEPLGVQVALIARQPNEGCVTYATLGLSRHVLSMPNDRNVRQELLFAVHAQQADDLFSKILFHVAESTIAKHRALLRGEVFPLNASIAVGATCSNLYVSAPVVFPAGIATYPDSVPPTVFAWLIPITSAEADEIHSHGWNNFEDKLEQLDVDLFDVFRSSLF